MLILNYATSIKIRAEVMKMYTILIADDEPMMRKSLHLILQSTNLEIAKVLLARDGEEALKLCEEYTPDIIVTDVSMPKMDGLDLCSYVNEKYSCTSLIIISGYDDFKYAQKALKYGVKEYLLKPVNREDFILCIENCINKIKQNEANIIEQNSTELKELVNDDFGKSSIIENIIDGILKKFHGLSLRHCSILSEKLVDHIIGAVGNKTGEKFDFKVDSFTGDTKSEFYLWFRNVMLELNGSVNDLRVDIKFYAIKLAKEYVKENYYREFSLDDISCKIGFNPSYFSKLFKVKTGQTFAQYRNQIRIENAKELLEKTNKSVTQVAMDVGFNDISHFIKIYKKSVGETPNEYREKRGLTLS
jgi:two-component system, response regulator YesN